MSGSRRRIFNVSTTLHRWLFLLCTINQSPCRKTRYTTFTKICLQTCLLEMAHYRKLGNAIGLRRDYGRINLLASWRDGLANLTVVHMELNRNQQTRPHYHPFEEIVIVINGTPTAMVADEIFELEPMDCLAIFANEPHKFQNMSSGVCELIIAISPHRNPDTVVYLAK